MADIPELKQYLSYNNPNISVIRTGEIGDEYVNRNDSLPVVHNMITLLEIPSERYGVRISGLTEITHEQYRNIRSIGENEFLVYYPSGIIMFNEKKEGQTFLVNYEGRGVILLSSDRVYMMYQKNPSVLVTLTDFANEIRSQLKVVNERIKKYEQVAEYTLLAAEKARQASDQAVNSAELADIARDRAIVAAESTVMIYKNPVPEYDDLFEYYPNPQNGYRVMVLKTGDVYRYDSIITRSWQLIDNITKYLIPIVTEEYDGILASSDYVKLMRKPIGLPFEKITQGGIQGMTFQIPYDAYLNKCYAFMGNNQSDSQIEIEVQMITEEDFFTLHGDDQFDDEGNIIIKPDWRNIFRENIVINPSEYYDQGTIEQPYQTVEMNTFYRINFKQFDNKMGGITIQFDFWIKPPVVYGDTQLLN